MDKKIRLAGTVAACIGLAVLGGAFSIRFQPNGSPFRPDIITLTNDVGEKIVVLKSTVKDEPKTGKEILKGLANDVKSDLENSSKPVERSRIVACLEADSKANDAESAQSTANSWRDNEYAESLANLYDNQAQEARAASAEMEKDCQSQFAVIKKERDKLKVDASASKQLIALAGTPGAYQKYVPTYSFKLLVTDVNGKSNVIPTKITCLNANAVNVFSRQRRKNLAPHSFVGYSKPAQMTIVTSIESSSNMPGYGGSVMPTEDAMYFASQEVCKFKGHVSVEVDLSKVN